MMKKLLPFLCASALALSLTACAGTINNSTADAASDVTFTFTDSGVTAAGETNTGYEIDGTALTITDSGTYTVSGSCADGSIKVKKGTTGVTLVLDGLTLTSEDTAAITCGKSSEVTILVSDGTENSLSDTEQNNDDNYPENENAENAVIKCKDGSTVTLCGDGELAVTANGKNGIKSGATTDEDGEALLTIRDLTLNIDAPVNDAINAEQLLNVESGTLTIDAADDAIHCDLVLNIGADGTDGPTIDITNCCEGLEGAGFLGLALGHEAGDVDEADGAAVASAPEGEGHLAVVAIDEVALAEGAADERLNRVDGAHVGFGHADDLLVKRRAQIFEHPARGPETEREAGTLVPVEVDGACNERFAESVHDVLLYEKVKLQVIVRPSREAFVRLRRTDV